MTETWRGISSEIIRKVIKDNPGLSDKELKKLISSNYPFGERSHHPYKIWLNEIKRQFEYKDALKNFMK